MKRKAKTEDEKLIEQAIKLLEAKCRVADGESFTNPSHVSDFFRLKLGGRPEETFACMFLTTKHKLIAYEELFHGTVDGSEVHPRVVARKALEHNAAAVIFGHNHPSGDPTPSAADRACTARLKQALALLDIRVLDHFIVGEGKPVSLAAMGMV